SGGVPVGRTRPRASQTPAGVHGRRRLRHLRFASLPEQPDQGPGIHRRGPTARGAPHGFHGVRPGMESLMPVVTYRNATYEIRESETVLEALLRGGVDLPFSCRKGSCQACLLRATRGSPPADAQSRLAPELVSTGHFM